MFRFRKPKIGLALGGGSAKGLSHIGVIKILEANNIPIDFIAGTSIGALIGGSYAALRDISKIEEFVLATNWREILPLIDPSIFKGLIGGDKIKKFIDDRIGKISFDDLEIPFTAVATDFETGEPVYISTGKVSDAIRASISLPLVFKPVKYRERLLTDGGLSAPVPVAVLKDMGAKIIIAVNLLTYYSTNNKSSKASLGFYNIANDTINILNHHLANDNVKDADLVIRPNVKDIGWKNILTRDGSREAITAGEKAMLEKLEELKVKLSKKRFWL